MLVIQGWGVAEDGNRRARSEFHASSMFYQAHLSGHLEAVDIQMSEAYKPLFWMI